MNTTVKSLQDVYVALGGSLTDTYEDIDGGVAVSDYTTIPDVIEAISQLAGKTLELPKTTSADAGSLLVVNEDGDWDKDDGMYQAVADAQLNGTTTIPLPNIDKKRKALIVINGSVSSTNGVISVNGMFSISLSGGNSLRKIIEVTKITDEEWLISCGDNAYTSSVSSVVTGITVSPQAISFGSGTTARVYMK